MWYTMADSTKHYPLTIEMVKKIKAQNKEGIRPEVLETAEITTGKPKEVEPEYADIVGQISLKSLEKTTRKRRDKERGQQLKQQGSKQIKGQGTQVSGDGGKQIRIQQKNQQQQRPQEDSRQQRPPNQQKTQGQGRQQRPPQKREQRPPGPDAKKD